MDWNRYSDALIRIGKFRIDPSVLRELPHQLKRYIKGKVRRYDYSEALTHAQQAGNRFIIVASTNNVDATVWRYVYNSFQQNEYRQVIFDKDVLLLLSAVTGIDITKLLN
jgi:hypothetical protein